MPHTVKPMLATLVDAPFQNDAWLYEVKWDGYRALAFLEKGKIRLVSRNQNDLTAQYPEVGELASRLQAESAIVDGEIVALDEQGHPSFGLLQQRAGTTGARRRAPQPSIPVLYYAFDLIYLNGYDLTSVALEDRKALLAGVLATDSRVRYSEHFDDGMQLFEAARAQGLEGIVAKLRRSSYQHKRSRDWLKIKLTQRAECVVGGYIDPKGSREHFGSLVLGLYDAKGRLIHVGQAGSGFTEATHQQVWQRLQELETSHNPFYGKVEALRRTHWVRPELVAEIKFTEWTHETEAGGMKMRAPVFQGLRFDKAPRECVFEKALPAENVALRSR
jgi:bifunctional non-homologous end joining protein LigD